MPKINDIVDQLVLHPITIDMTYKYKNCVELSAYHVRSNRTCDPPSAA